MKSSTIYYIISVAALIASAVIVVCKEVPQDELQLMLTKGVAPASLLHGRPGSTAARNLSKPEALVEPAQPEVRSADEIQKLFDQLPVLKEIPWRSSEVAAMFSNHSARPCRLLPAEVSVNFAMDESLPGDGSMKIQRTTAFLIGLAVDSRARAKLPVVSKATIENYLDENRLAIQPEVCRDQKGTFQLTGQVYAAFFSRKSPSLTGSPEPMIVEATKNLRVLGMLPASSKTNQPESPFALPGEEPVSPNDPPNGENLPRTLVMAFSYMRDTSTTSLLTLGPEPAYELIFLHLLPQSAPAAQPEMAVFATSDGCTRFQELNLSRQDQGGSDPAVQANVRFEKFKLLGQYPADPIVTSLSNRIRSNLSLEELQKRISSRTEPVGTALQLVLDELHRNPAL